MPPRRITPFNPFVCTRLGVATLIDLKSSIAGTEGQLLSAEPTRDWHGAVMLLPQPSVMATETSLLNDAQSTLRDREGRGKAHRTNAAVWRGRVARPNWGQRARRGTGGTTRGMAGGRSTHLVTLRHNGRAVGGSERQPFSLPAPIRSSRSIKSLR